MVDDAASRLGYRPVERLSTWTPRVLDRMPAAMEFLQYIKRREPFIVRVDPSNATHYVDGFEDDASANNAGDGEGDGGADGGGGGARAKVVPPDDYNVSPCGERTFKELGWKVCDWNPTNLCQRTGHERTSLATSVAGKHGVFAVSCYPAREDNRQRMMMMMMMSLWGVGVSWDPDGME